MNPSIDRTTWTPEAVRLNPLSASLQPIDRFPGRRSCRRSQRARKAMDKDSKAVLSRQDGSSREESVRVTWLVDLSPLTSSENRYNSITRFSNGEPSRTSRQRSKNPDHSPPESHRTTESASSTSSSVSPMSPYLTLPPVFPGPLHHIPNDRPSHHPSHHHFADNYDRPSWSSSFAYPGENNLDLPPLLMHPLPPIHTPPVYSTDPGSSYMGTRR